MTTITTMPPTSSVRNVLIIDGQYANIGALKLFGTKLDYKQLRKDLETLVEAEFTECWYFDHEKLIARSPYQNQNPFISSLKLAPPMGPQFQIKMYAMKSYKCHCPNCGLNFTQNVQKGVDNGIATKMLSLAYEDMADRIVLLAEQQCYIITAGDGDFYDTLDLVRNIRHKDLWVVGYQRSLSPDLQQLASKVVWLEDLIPKTISASLNESNDISVQATTDARPEPQAARAPNLPPEITTVYIGNIGQDMNRALLRATFEHCGVILGIRINERGFCFMDFASQESAELASGMDGVIVAQRRLVVNVERRGRTRSPRFGPSPPPPVQNNNSHSCSTTRTLPELLPPAIQENKAPILIRGKKRPVSAISVSPTSSSSSSTEGTPRKKFKRGHTVFVGGLSANIDYSKICEIFDKCGTIVDIDVPPRRRDTICFITFATDESANAACKLNGTLFQDRQLIVERHRKKKKNRRGQGDGNSPRNRDKLIEAPKPTSPKSSLLSAASNRRVQIDKLIAQVPKAIMPRSKPDADVITVEPDVIDLCLSSDEDDA
ncbi:hypothetical protein THRCLA_08029 [Thraustotheca clavata]|uniref:Meiosis regulator and mRNA stability factor 1 n=1 Tax=Thraustotheca clavata TaxID=74557 RepID=A0A1V9ZAM9_9STRA|nr:hypothetical protein THRCLA_08029 [Thraustotheca clavata]